MCVVVSTKNTVKIFITPLEAELDAKFEYRVFYRCSDDCKFYVDYIIKTPKVAGTAQKDLIMPKLRVQHSYSGDVRYSFMFGAWRQVCSNGMGVMDEERVLATKHTKHRLNQTLTKTIESLDDFVARFEEYVKPYKDMQREVILDVQTRLDEVIHATKFPISLREDVLERMRFEKENFGYYNTNWLLYNAMNFQLNHNFDTFSMQEHNRSKLDAEIFSQLRVS